MTRAQTCAPAISAPLPETRPKRDRQQQKKATRTDKHRYTLQPPEHKHEFNLNTSQPVLFLKKYEIGGPHREVPLHLLRVRARSLVCACCQGVCVRAVRPCRPWRPCLCELKRWCVRVRTCTGAEMCLGRQSVQLLRIQYVLMCPYRHAYMHIYTHAYTHVYTHVHALRLIEVSLAELNVFTKTGGRV